MVLGRGTGRDVSGGLGGKLGAECGVSSDAVEQNDEFAHDGHESYLSWFPGVAETAVECSQWAATTTLTRWRQLHLPAGDNYTYPLRGK